ncbi:beta-1,6-glucan boisynthesis protein-like protein [Melanomma pulvis-pyrius CBS 109.77]|uniref:Beta-1,6-glucan boisynthesis protein-like protein n=1 Tax=Melanomma pulvis-pyrius CBS 109.77 TaxID=1314802 RepID=A0A6A6X6D1_9PLEO|nr:beta-1,6-glucan boisynthesis protein-like protein [Melanomma pulvis-pyrius CBS 109.77]
MVRNVKLWAPLAALAALAPLVSADVEFTAPKAGATFDGGTTITVQWQESKDTPLISALTTYQLFLCMGGNDAATMVKLTAPGAKTFTVTGNQATGMVGVGVGASTPKNAYFLKMISTATAGGIVTNFSPRFSFKSMTGTFSNTVITAMKTVTGTDGPSRIDATTDKPAGAVPQDGDFGVEYTMQTGATRYAPMQAVPPTKITKKKATPLHPTSSVDIARAMLPNPKQQTTVTQSQTFSIKSVENTAAPAPMPSDDMAKFLNRWKD